LLVQKIYFLQIKLFVYSFQLYNMIETYIIWIWSLFSFISNLKLIHNSPFLLRLAYLILFLFQRLPRNLGNTSSSRYNQSHPFQALLYFSIVAPLSGRGTPPGTVMFLEMDARRSGESISHISYCQAKCICLPFQKPLFF